MNDSERFVRISGQKGIHKIVGESPTLYQVENDNGFTFWVPKERTTPDIKIPLPAPEPHTPRKRTSKHLNDTTDVVVSGKFFDYLVNGCTIIGSGPERFKNRFEFVYARVSGHVLNGQGRHMSWTAEGRARFYSMRVVFPTPTIDVDMPLEAHPLSDKPGFHEISRNDFVWELLALGFDLGYNGRI